jgi:phosphopantothenoylcysteine decarboxylase / phosphopantothenate---cysteine ligase
MKHSILLIISGSIAAIKSPELIRQLRANNIGVRCIVTKSGQEFVSLKEIVKLSGQPVSVDLFSAKEKEEMWHIRFSRETDLIVIAPASANLIAKMAGGIADDMASATLLANNKKLLVAPAMNTYMWVHPATQRNVKQIIKDGAEIIEPGVGMLACGEVGAGRMAEPQDIVAAILKRLNVKQPLSGMKALVTSGPTYEAIDPVRFIGNRSSGKQGHAIAKALANQGAQVTLVTGPTSLPDPQGVNVRHVTSADEMLIACEKTLPADIAVCAAAVADWKMRAPARQKIKKNGAAPMLQLMENRDILKYIATHRRKRPKLVIGFAAETSHLLKTAAEKRKSKQCDWIIANDVADGKGFDADENRVALITAKKSEQWPLISKQAVAERLAERIITHLGKKS